MADKQQFLDSLLDYYETKMGQASSSRGGAASEKTGAGVGKDIDPFAKMAQGSQVLKKMKGELPAKEIKSIADSWSLSSKHLKDINKYIQSISSVQSKVTAYMKQQNVSQKEAVALVQKQIALSAGLSSQEKARQRDVINNAKKIHQVQEARAEADQDSINQERRERAKSYAITQGLNKTFAKHPILKTAISYGLEKKGIISEGSTMAMATGRSMPVGGMRGAAAKGGAAPKGKMAPKGGGKAGLAMMAMSAMQGSGGSQKSPGSIGSGSFMGDVSGSMMSGANIGSIAGPKGAIVGAVIGLVVGVVKGMANALARVVIGMFDVLNKAFDGGIAGLLQGTLDTVTHFISKIPIVGEALGGILGAVFGFLIKAFMFEWEDAIKRNKQVNTIAARTGVNVSDNFAESLKAQIGRSRDVTGEWIKGLAPGGRGVFENRMARSEDTGDQGLRYNKKGEAIGRDVETQFQRIYRLGVTMDMSAQETGGYFNQMRGYAFNTVTATQEMTNSLMVAKNMAARFGVDAGMISKAIADSAASARMFNVDLKTVRNTMGMLLQNASQYEKFGVSVANRGPELLRQMTGIASQWDEATHIFAGMGMYAQKYKEQTGQEMTAGRAYIASRYGMQTAANFSMEGGLWNTGQTQQQTMAGGTDNMADKLQFMQRFAVEQTAGIQDEGERMIAQKKILQDIFKVQDEDLQAVIMNRNTDFQSLAQSKELKDKMMTTQQIQLRLKDIAEHNEDLQRQLIKIAFDILQMLIGVGQIIIGSAKMLAGILLLTTPAGLAAELIGKISGTQGMRPSQLVSKGWDQASEGIDNFTLGLRAAQADVRALAPVYNQFWNYSERGRAAAQERGRAEQQRQDAQQTDTHHTGGPVAANRMFIGQLGEGIRMRNDEFAMISPSSLNVIPRSEAQTELMRGQAEVAQNSQNTTRSGSNTVINISIDGASKETIMHRLYGALNEHLS